MGNVKGGNSVWPLEEERWFAGSFRFRGPLLSKKKEK
jgi:hypothetical protein